VVLELVRSVPVAAPTRPLPGPVGPVTHGRVAGCRCAPHPPAGAHRRCHAARPERPRV